MISEKIEVRGHSFKVFYDHYHDYWSRVASGQWEPEMIGLMDAVVRPTTLFVDIGAWMGPTTLFAAALGAEVIAFEPDPVAFQRLVRNVSINPNLRQSIELYNAACGQEDGKVALYADALGNSESSILKMREHHLGIGAQMIEFEADVLDIEKFLTQRCIRARDVFFKIDVEGAEFDLLPHMAKFYREMPRAIINVSTHPFNVNPEEPEAQSEQRREAKKKVFDSLAGLVWLEWTEGKLKKVDEEQVREKAFTDLNRADFLTVATYDVVSDSALV